MRKLEGYQKGLNLGGWLSQYDAPVREHFDTFITEQDIEKIRSFGADHVRIPVDYEIFEEEDGTEKELGMEYVDKCVEWCKKNGLRVVLDLHRTFGYTFDPLEKGGDKEIFFKDSGMQERFFAIWRRFAKQYGQEPDLVAFELLNEIVSPNVVEEWNEVAEKAIHEIRAIAPRTYIILGGVQHNHVTSVPDLRKPYDDRIVYNFHCYEPMIFTHQRAWWMDEMPKDITVQYPEPIESYREKTKPLELGEELESPLYDKAITELGESFFEHIFQPAIEAAEKNGAPLYCGEYGAIDQAPVEGTLNWLRDIHAVFERHGIGHALWTYKSKDFGLMGPHYDPIRDEMIRLL